MAEHAVALSISTTTSRITWEWLAGYTDGSGWVGKTGHSYQIRYSSTQPEELPALRDFFAAHGIHASIYDQPYRTAPNRQSLIVGRRADVHAAIHHLLPHLVLKRERFAHVDSELHRENAN